MRPTLRAVFLAVPLALVTAGTAVASDGGLAPVTPASPNAAAIRDIWWVILGITGVIFIIVETALVVFIVKYRRGRRPREVEGAAVHGNTRLEIIWTVVPVLIVFAIVAVVFAKLPDVKDVPPANAANSLNIQVEGHQFYWLYRYPDGQVSIDQMVVPVERRRNADRERDRRDPRLVDPRARRPDRRHPRPHEPHLVPGEEGRHATSGSAHSSAASTTRR